MLKVVLRGLLKDLLGERKGIRGVKIKIMSKKKSSSALEKGQIKHVG